VEFSNTGFAVIFVPVLIFDGDAEMPDAPRSTAASASFFAFIHHINLFY